MFFAKNICRLWYKLSDLGLIIMMADLGVVAMTGIIICFGS